MQTAATQDLSGGPALRQTASSDADAAATRRHSAEVSPTWKGKILLSDSEGAALWDVGLRTFLKLQHEEWFPQPVILGPRLKRHVRAELEAAVAQMPRQGRLAEPAQLLKSRVERAMRTGVSRVMPSPHQAAVPPNQDESRKPGAPT